MNVVPAKGHVISYLKLFQNICFKTGKTLDFYVAS